MNRRTEETLCPSNERDSKAAATGEYAPSSVRKSCENPAIPMLSSLEGRKDKQP
jgi:hypothetical protein